MEVLLPIIMELVISKITERCKDKVSKSQLMGLAYGGGDVPWRIVRRATKDATRQVKGKRYWRQNKSELLAEARAKMNDADVVTEVMGRVYEG